MLKCRVDELRTSNLGRIYPFRSMRKLHRRAKAAAKGSEKGGREVLEGGERSDRDNCLITKPIHQRPQIPQE